MITGRVAGSIVSTVQHPFYSGKTLLIVDRIDAGNHPTGDYLVAIDTVGAGPGERVLVLDEGNGARQVVGDAVAPLRSVIVGIIDEMTVE